LSTFTAGTVIRAVNRLLLSVSVLAGLLITHRLS
jgi:hypothetical protein